MTEEPEEAEFVDVPESTDASTTISLDVKVMVDKKQLEALVALNAELKDDIIALVTVFQTFSTLFTGKANLMAVAGIVTKLVSNPQHMATMSAIVPIIEKYTTPQQNG